VVLLAIYLATWLPKVAKDFDKYAESRFTALC
jgi:hypothetical protein